MVEKYERAIDSHYPQVYYTFMAKGLETDELVEYCVRDLTEDHFMKTIELVTMFLMPEETLQKAARIAENDFAKRTLLAYFEKSLKEKLSLGCFVTGTNELVGLNLLVVKSKGHSEKHSKLEDHDFINLILSLKYVEKKFNVFDHFNVDHYLSGVGLCVDPRYRSRGIAVGILKARKNFLPQLNLKVTSTLFTTIGSQKAAVKAGYTEQSTTSYEEIQQNFPDMDFSVADATHCKILTLEV